MASKKSDTSQPHDSLVRNVLADINLAADLFKNYLPPEWVSRLEWDSLQQETGDTVDPNLSRRMGDLRYSARIKGSDATLRVFVFFEHQSKPDRFMRLRMLEYMCALYRQQFPVMKRGMRFPYPLAVVLHHGAKPWKSIPTMEDLIAMPPGTEGSIPSLPITLIDLATMSPDDLRGHPMVCALLDCLQSASLGILPARIKSVIARLRETNEDNRVPWLTALFKYYEVILIHMNQTVDNFEDILTGLYTTKEAKKMALTLTETIEMRGEARGEARGMTKGAIKSITTVLESRFGAIPRTLRKKLENIHDIDQLDALLKLAATCKSLKEFQKGI